MNLQEFHIANHQYVDFCKSSICRFFRKYQMKENKTCPKSASCFKGNTWLCFDFNCNFGDISVSKTERKAESGISLILKQIQ